MWFALKKESILNDVYEKCAISLCGGSQILLVNGGAGTGKTKFICDLLNRFSSEKFQFTSSILVCGFNNALVDKMTETILLVRKITNIGKWQSGKHFT